MTPLVQIPIVAFAYAVETLRRLPGASRVRGVVPWVGRLLLVAAFGALVAWMATKTPQRMSIADLAANKLSPMQSWIIVSGDLVEESSLEPGSYMYRLTDPGTPGPSMIVLSDVPLATGRTTLSGLLQGGRLDPSALVGPWVGTLVADPVLAHEIPPPWPAAALALAGLVVLGARRTSYPMFFRGKAGTAPPTRATLHATLRRRDATGARETPAVVTLGSGDRPEVEIRTEGASPRTVRLHSEFTGSGAGDLRGLTWSRPAILLRLAAEDVTIAFESAHERDAVFGVLRTGARELTQRGAVFRDATRSSEQG